MTKLHVTIACGTYDRTIPLQDGTVSAPGLDINFLPMGPSDLFRRQARHAEFDIAEFSFSTYCMLRSRGDDRMIAVPVFPSRKFRHSHIFVNDAVKEPSDLIGKQVGVHEFQNTASTWIRGILKDDYGVAQEDMRWVLGGLNAPKPQGDRIPMNFSPAMEVTRATQDQALSDMLQQGEISGIISAEIPESFRRPASGVRRLFPDYQTIETEYYQRTRIFPIMHTVVIKSALYDRYPWIARTVIDAFEEAKRVGQSRLRYSAVVYSSLPWLSRHIEDLDLMTGGEDLFAYGLESNRHVLETFLRYSQEQGLIDHPLAVDDLFAPEAL